MGVGLPAGHRRPLRRYRVVDLTADECVQTRLGLAREARGEEDDTRSALASRLTAALAQSKSPQT